MDKIEFIEIPTPLHEKNRKFQLYITEIQIIRDVFREINKKIEDLGIDFTAIATDLKTGEEVYLNKGNLVKAILASVCLPGICHPITIEENY